MNSDIFGEMLFGEMDLDKMGMGLFSIRTKLAYSSAKRDLAKLDSAKWDHATIKNLIYYAY